MWAVLGDPEATGAPFAMRIPLLLALLLHQGWGLGCMIKVCQGNPDNTLRSCPDADGTCGNFHTLRANGEIADAVDIKCAKDAVVKAPFDGEMYFWRPFGGAKEKKCADEGVRIEGTGQWQGYAVHISSLKLKFFGGVVKAGDEIGTAKDRNCFNAAGQLGSEPHIEMRLFMEGKLVDPTFHLQSCMCTGQICESNRRNTLLGEPFKADKRYNGVRGWDLECPMVDEVGEDPRVPLIYSPITGEVVGRTRISYDGNGYTGCENDGMFIVGTEDWIGFEVRIYNMRTRSDIGFGRKRLVQGEPIGSRLNCTGSPDSVFLEVRYQGRVVNITDVITANKCQLPSMPEL